MRLLNILSLRKYSLIYILTILTFFVVGYPLLVYGIDKTFFFSIDPDVVYLTNAVLYTKHAIISYADHPGTPTIMILYTLFIPIRIIAKYFLNISFPDWSFDNFALVTYVGRFAMLIIFCLSIFFILKSIRNLTKSNLLVFFTWVSLLTFLGLGQGIQIIPENFLVFLTTLWIFTFTKFVKYKSYKLNLILIFISGIAVANKFTAIFLAIASILLIFYIRNINFEQKILRLQLNVLVFFGSFYLGILPAIKRFTYIKNWMVSLFLHSGTHGTGPESVLDLKIYIDSAGTLISGAPILFIYILVSVFLSAYLLIKRKIRLTEPFIFIFAISILGIIVFAKFPLMHYFVVNFVLLIFCTLYFLSKLFNLTIVKIFVLALSMQLILNFIRFSKGVKIEMNLDRQDTVYSTLNAWTPFWSSDVYREQFDKIK